MPRPKTDMVPSSSSDGGKEFPSLFSFPPRCIALLPEPVQLLVKPYYKTRLSLT